MTNFTDMVRGTSRQTRTPAPAYSETRSWRRNRRGRKLAALASITA